VGLKEGGEQTQNRRGKGGNQEKGFKKTTGVPTSQNYRLTGFSRMSREKKIDKCRHGGHNAGKNKCRYNNFRGENRDGKKGKLGGSVSLGGSSPNGGESSEGGRDSGGIGMEAA